MKLKLFSPDTTQAIEAAQKSHKKAKAIKVQQLAKANAEKEKPVIISRIVRNQMTRKLVRESEKSFKTMKRDLTKMISVKVDRKTYILVPVGTDIEEARRKYEHRQSCRS